MSAPHAPRTVVLHLGGVRHEVPCAAGQTVLQAARAAGLRPPFACEEGFCGTCIAKLVRGTAEMARCEALAAEDVADGYLLACQARPTSADCELRWD